ELGGVPERLLDVVMRLRLTHPARGIGYIAVIKPPFTAKVQDLALDLVVVLVVLADAGKLGNFGLIVETPHRYRPMLAGIVDQELGAFLHLGLGGAAPFYRASLINGGGHDAMPVLVRSKKSGIPPSSAGGGVASVGFGAGGCSLSRNRFALALIALA